MDNKLKCAGGEGCYAINPSGDLVEYRARDLKPGWRWATEDDVRERRSGAPSLAVESSAAPEPEPAIVVKAEPFSKLDAPSLKTKF